MAGDYQEALPLYINLYEKGYPTANISYKIGMCYLSIPGMKTRAIPYLKDAVQRASSKYSGTSLTENDAPLKALLYLGIGYRINYDFTLAESAFSAFIDSVGPFDAVNNALALYHMERCQNAKELIASPVRLQMDTLPVEINNSFSNFNPLVTEDEKLMIYNEQLKFYDAVMQVIRENTAWQKPENITPQIKSDGDHNVTGISMNGEQLLLSAYDAYMSGEIYLTEYINGRWTKLRLLNNNINTQFNETHASLSEDGKTLYFTSDRPGGYGGLDIYKAERDEADDWGPPVNIGPTVNSPYNEETPFVANHSGILYFSSQGHYNMGGYDIFYSERTANGSWQYPVNIGFPINTTDDDLFYYPLHSDNAAYKSAFDNKTSDLDIIRYEILETGNPARFIIRGKIETEDSSGFNTGDIMISIISKAENDTVTMQQIDQSGSFRQKVPSGSYKFEIKDKDSSVYISDLEIPPYFPNRELMLNASISIRPGTSGDTVLIRDIFFGFDKSGLDDEARIALDQLIPILNKYPELSVTLNGYTDAIGSESYNLKLSLERAGRTRDFLLDRDIAQDRIFMNGYGENNPVALNTTPSGNDSPRGRRFNRRVEIIVNNTPENLIIIKENLIPENLRTE